MALRKHTSQNPASGRGRITRFDRSAFAVGQRESVETPLLAEGRGRTLVSVTEDMDMSKPSDLVQGTLDMLLLKILALEPMNGFAVSQRLKQVSGDVLQVSDGSLYPALHKLEQEDGSQPTGKRPIMAGGRNIIRGQGSGGDSSKKKQIAGTGFPAQFRELLSLKTRELHAGRNGG